MRVDCDGEMIRGSPITFNVGGVNGKQTISVLKRDQGVVGEESKFEVRIYVTSVLTC